MAEKKDQKKEDESNVVHTETGESLALTEENYRTLIEGLISGEITVVEQDPDEAQLQIMRSIMAADSEDDIFADRKATSARDYLGVPLYIDSFKLAKGDFEGNAAFAIIQAREASNNNSLVLTCGGKTVLTQLMTAQVKKLMPFKKAKMFTQPANPTSSGYFPLWLVNAE